MSKKLKLNKQTVSDLSRDELSKIKAGEAGCWENIWTLYWCDVVYTAAPQTTLAVPDPAS